MDGSLPEGFCKGKDSCTADSSSITIEKEYLDMSKIAVVYWSSSGNTEAMAKAVAEGAKAGGLEKHWRK